MKKLLLGLLFLTACARPDYINPAAKNNAQSPPAAECTLKLAQSQLCASIQWVSGPQSPDESEFILKFWNESTATINGPYTDPTTALSVILWMPSMGHGSSPVKIDKIETGVYRVHRVFFIMPGDWEVRIFLKDGATTVDHVIESLQL
ncbi:serine protease spb1 [Bdellovibrio sp. ZAP7]|uniref:FixH family protein n=1 Tax=Bdellovibrio sp. ZAP7 TaxID=2231053 RepID=UPI001157E64D|nr:FixH family protein [Bdellovibrio sp. ZAP7]QDK45858.1 serine protease spb1 [Bdellovibrio sp. ZAP7]